MTLKVAALQLAPTAGDVAANLRGVEAGLRAAADLGVEIVGLPEMWPTSFVEVRERDWLPVTRAATARAAELSAELGLVVFGSAFAGPPDAAGRLFNRLTVWDSGRAVLEFDKVHLFTPTGERESFRAGAVPPATVLVRGVRLSGAVCYDLRFGPLWHRPWVEEAELLVVPAQWPTPRASHWRALVLGRAAEHQAFVVAVNRTGTAPLARRGEELSFPGNSIVAGPDGTARAEGSGADGLIVWEVDPEEARALRRAIPVRRDQRPGTYFR
jgi:predicted amidohydrolase